jgi:hypothetical protein
MRIPHYNDRNDPGSYSQEQFVGRGNARTEIASRAEDFPSIMRQGALWKNPITGYTATLKSCSRPFRKRLTSRTSTELILDSRLGENEFQKVTSPLIASPSPADQDQDSLFSAQLEYLWTQIGFFGDCYASFYFLGPGSADFDCLAVDFPKDFEHYCTPNVPSILDHLGCK